MNYQWYPGHMTKAKRMMEENIKLIDIVIEVLDARIPMSSRNPDIDTLGKNKSRLILLNKSDLADEQSNQVWKEWFEEQGFFVIEVNSRSGAGIRQINNVVKEACKEKIERDRKRGILNRPVRAMVVGIPNVGKSTFINSYAKKACTKTGNKPGVTKGQQWIKLSKEIELLDTPGILWPKFEDQMVGLRLALTGSINDEILNIEELALELIKIMKRDYPGVIEERYGIESSDDIIYNINEIAKVRGCLLKGGNYDTVKAARLLIDDFRNGKLGRITLEMPDRRDVKGDD
ncbi:MAG: ribosome biogenesis GTPase YlqF [Lachnospiraceae bacterium]|nr:ribosome biogenesis GTPase YlqF [Lachnospiraceae bacterium]